MMQVANSPANTATTNSAHRDDRLLKAAEVADLLGCSVRLVWTLRSTRKLEAVKVASAIRFRLSDVQRIIAEGAPR